MMISYSSRQLPVLLQLDISTMLLGVGFSEAFRLQELAVWGFHGLSMGMADLKRMNP